MLGLGQVVLEVLGGLARGGAKVRDPPSPEAQGVASHLLAGQELHHYEGRTGSA